MAALIYVKNYDAQVAESAKNYAIGFPQPPVGWVAIPHGPQSLFMYRNLKSNALIRGGVNQIISDFNPTPGLGTNGIAQYYIDRTKENMPDWVAQKLGMVDAKNTSFRLIKRQRKGKVVVTAFSVKGNTTVLVTLASDENREDTVAPQMKLFSTFLSQISLNQKDMSAL